MIEGIILAAGYSQRTKSNKLLFKYEGKPLINHAIDGMLPHVHHIYVITGHNRELIEPLINKYQKVTAVFNVNYAKGMFSSIKTGVMLTNNDILILPGDCPFVKKETYQKILSAQGEMIVPRYNGRKGHPMFINAILKKKILDEPLSSNLKLFRDKHEFTIIDTDDPHILTDIDTVQDFQNLQ
jgi:molybdenum cofactor cytidylyltransferase